MGAELYQKFNPDIVFTDIMMPDYNGFYAISEIKKINPQAKIFAVTASVNRGSEQKLIQMNITVIPKPFNVVEIINMLKSYA